ncbi:MAG: Stp1/IreP family PP2C-type Ser/Thr phosphatase [Pseudomonadota bacterium]
MRVRAFGGTHPGQVREHNEDAFLIDERNGVFVVADGMGGHQAGEVASQLVIGEVSRQARELSAAVRQQAMASADGRRAALQTLPRVIAEANRLVYGDARKHAAHRGMGTTVVLFMPVGEEAYVCHVGDSRLYLLRGDGLFQVTEDHSLVNRLVRQGQLTPEEAQRHPHKNLITRCVGIQAEVEVDTLYLDLQAGDRFLLCSDGLSDMVSCEDLRGLCRLHRGQELVQAAITAANEAGGVDNITAVVLEVEADSPAQHPARLGMLQRVEFLQDIFLFADLNDQECVRVNRVLYEERHPARQQILRKGDVGEEFYIVVAGSVGIWDNGVRLTSIGPGRHFGEFALLEDLPRSADVWTELDCVLLVIRRADFLDLVRSDPGLGVKIYQAFLKHLADRVRDLSGRVGKG